MQPAPAAHAQAVNGCGHGQQGRETLGGWVDFWELGIEPFHHEWEIVGRENDRWDGKS